MSSSGAAPEGEHTYVLVTGANSGLGMGICRRLIDEFIRTQPLSSHFTLIFTTRDAEKGEDTLAVFEKQLSSFGTSFAAQRFTKRVHLRPENVELTNLLSVRALCRHLLQSDIPKIDAIILNAGIGGWYGIYWPLAFWQVLTDLIQGVTWPLYKLSSIGRITASQLPATAEGKHIAEPPLGEVFCANVFGHYMLVHGVMPLLRSCDPQSPGKIIWISSIEVGGQDFNADDLQGLTSTAAYSHTKRLTDLLALTAQDQTATAKTVNGYLDSKPKHSVKGDGAASPKPVIWLSHPGICATSIVPLMFLLRWSMYLTCYFARIIGSPWHTISAYSGANAPAWLALATPEEIKNKGGDVRAGSVKWGSATDRVGTEKVVMTDVQGWGLNGSGEKVDWWGGSFGRIRGAKDATNEDVENFVVEGARAWREMEQLREEWETRLDEYEGRLARE